MKQMYMIYFIMFSIILNETEKKEAKEIKKDDIDLDKLTIHQPFQIFEKEFPDKQDFTKEEFLKFILGYLSKENPNKVYRSWEKFVKSETLNEKEKGYFELVRVARKYVSVFGKKAFTRNEIINNLKNYSIDDCQNKFIKDEIKQIKFKNIQQLQKEQGKEAMDMGMNMGNMM